MTRSLYLLAFVGVLATAYRRVLHPWQERWGARDEELIASLPGDDLIAEPAGQVTRAIEIAAPREGVWPWVIQLGADRGGFYSYDWLENLFRLDIHSADRIVPEWQERAVGDLVHADAKGDYGWVRDGRPAPYALVLKMANVKEGRPFRRDDPPYMEFTWAFVLEPEWGEQYTTARPGAGRVREAARTGRWQPGRPHQLRDDAEDDAQDQEAC